MEDSYRCTLRRYENEPDNEVIKALERMSEEDPDGFSSEILSLINLQRQEINRLKEKIDTLLNSSIEK